MKLRQILFTALVSALPAGINAQQVAAHYTMSLTDGGKIEETVSHNQYTVTSQLPACTVQG